MLLLCASRADVPDVTGNRLSWTQVQDVGSTAQAGGFINNAAYAALFLSVYQYVGRMYYVVGGSSFSLILLASLQFQFMEWHNGKNRLYIAIIAIIPQGHAYRMIHFIRVLNGITCVIG